MASLEAPVPVLESQEKAGSVKIQGTPSVSAGVVEKSKEGELREEETGRSLYLKRSRAGHLGHLTRLYKEAEECIMKEDRDGLLIKIEQVDSCFANIFTAHQLYVNSLESEEERSKANTFLLSFETGKTEFDARVADCLKTMDRKPAKSLLGASQGSRKKVHSHSSASSHSSTSVRLKEARIKRAQAKLRQRQISEETELQRQLLELETKQKILEAKAEEELAEVEEEVWAAASSCGDTASQNSVDVHQPVNQSGTQPVNQSDTQPMKASEPKLSPKSKLNPEATPFECKAAATHIKQDNAVSLPRHDVTQSDQIIQGLIAAQREMSTTIATNFQLPKQELLEFSGNPKDYWRFITNFEANVGSVIDSRLKLNYLIQYCGGEAKEAIADCAILEPNQGYLKAKEILKSLFGQPHVISRTYIDELVNGPPIRPNDGKGLSQLGILMQRCQITLTQLRYDADMNNSESLLRIVRRLPMHVRARWADKAESIIESGHEPTFVHLTEFVQNRARVANNVYGKDLNQSKVPEQRFKKVNKSGRMFATHASASTAVSDEGREASTGQAHVCPLCKQHHCLWECKIFQSKLVSERFEFMKQNRLCNNCAKPGHLGIGCMERGACAKSGCKLKHHTLLHDDWRRQSRKDQVREDYSGRRPQSEIKVEGRCNATGAGSKGVCLKVVPVKIEGRGCTVETYALLDSCSDVSLCTRNLVDKLGVKGKRCEFSISTVNDKYKNMSGSEVELKVESLDGSQYVEVDRVWTVEQIPVARENIPQPCDIQKWPHLEGLSLPQINTDKVELLIGADVPEVFWVLDERHGKRKEPCAVRTLLGWTLFGPFSNVRNKSCHVNLTVSRDMNLQQQLELMWQTEFTESFSQSEVAMSVEDKKALDIMDSTVIHLPTGHYQLSLPWKTNPPELQYNRAVAGRRLQHLQKRLMNDGDLHAMYIESMRSYIDKGYASKVPKDKLDNGKWYLPHHPVTHPRKPGKVRVVFDCAAKHNHMSLNDQLLKGPDLTNNLVGVLTRFREWPYAVTADIEGMFNQVNVTPEDRCYLRFLWWEEGKLDVPPEEFEMNVHLFGATSSPSCTGYCLRKTASDNADDFSKEAVSTVHRNLYVDDCLKSGPSVQEMTQLVKELQHLLQRGGFRLNKWTSNNPHVLDEISADDKSAHVVDLDLDNRPGECVLGVKWNVVTDKFEFASVPKQHQLTRRGILSTVSSLYDPLGLVAPLTLPAKQLLQELCRQKYGWDEPIQEVYTKDWYNWLHNLSRIPEIKVPRCFLPEELQPPYDAQIHHFSDASQSGYGCVSYLRVVDSIGQIRVSIMIGKSRVTPIKAVTIPRLELTAATVAVKLDRMIHREIDIDVQDSLFWTDSTSVLQYIANEDKRFQVFVANRISLIHDHSRLEQWRYVKSCMNPADYASRGLNLTETDKIERWLKGPEFLWQEKVHWPVQPEIPGLTDIDPEIKKTARIHTTSKIGQEHPLSILIRRSSSWSQLLKSVAWLTRCKQMLLNRKNPSGQIQDVLKLKELQEAEQLIIKYVQKESFPEEIQALSQGSKEPKQVKSHSSLRRLNPILVDGMLRVGGRLERASIPFGAKHPMILPKKGHATVLVIRHYHHLEGHCGTNQVLCNLRRKFWIINGRATVRQVLTQCIPCRKRNILPGQQIMSPLPENRLIPDEAPFTHTGVDYFGPLLVKVGRSHVKRYGCLFTCLTSRAVHIEVAYSLDTSSFLCALHRFISRRGRPKEISSDNGTNFRGGDRELKEELQKWNTKKISDFLHQQEIEWKFNPPTASHMGGIWERMIKSVRHVLKAVLTTQEITDETLVTTLTEVEKILNDRPLTPVSDNADDLEPLTPSQILLLKSNSSLPPGVFDKEDNHISRRWKQAQYLANVFWRRWVKEYLPTLQVRQKWTTPRRNFAKNDLVLVSNENVPRGQWPMGRILETFPDRHGHVRSVELKTAVGKFVRPITHLCLLEGDICKDKSSEPSAAERERKRPVRASRGRMPRHLEDYV